MEEEEEEEEKEKEESKLSQRHHAAPTPSFHPTERKSQLKHNRMSVLKYLPNRPLHRLTCSFFSKVNISCIPRRSSRRHTPSLWLTLVGCSVSLTLQERYRLLVVKTWFENTEFRGVRVAGFVRQLRLSSSSGEGPHNLISALTLIEKFSVCSACRVLFIRI